MFLYLKPNQTMTRSDQRLSSQVSQQLSPQVGLCKIINQIAALCWKYRMMQSCLTAQPPLLTLDKGSYRATFSLSRIQQVFSRPSLISLSSSATLLVCLSKVCSGFSYLVLKLKALATPCASMHAAEITAAKMCKKVYATFSQVSSKECLFPSLLGKPRRPLYGQRQDDKVKHDANDLDITCLDT